MNLFENLQIMSESIKSVDDLFDDIVSAIHERFGCDIDDTWYDIDNYPEEFRCQLVVYNVGYNIAEEISNIIRNRLSNYEVVNVNVEEDDKYTSEFVDIAYMFRVTAYGENKYN